MTFSVAFVVFFGSLVLSAISSLVLASSLERIGTRLKLSEGLLGIMTALAADSPEISSALVALFTEHHELGTGVGLGFNIFNLVALLGLSAIVAGRVKIDHPVLLFNGTVALAVTIITTALILKIMSPVISVILILMLLIPYGIVSSLRSVDLARWRLPREIKRLLCALVDEVHKSARKDKTAPHATGNEALAIVPALASIILGSFGLVRSATVIGTMWHVPSIVLGIVILATLTGIPNLFAALHLARHNRGSAVVSEALNSNTLNLLSGICLPALVIGVGAVSSQALFAIWWLLGMTGLVIWLTYQNHKLSRRDGKFVTMLYVLFVGIVMLWA